MNKVVVLDNVRSAQNVGAIFRTSDGAGVEKIYLVGYTPSPIDRFGRVQAAIAKTSLGATSSVLWACIDDNEIANVLTTYKQRGYTIVAVEQTKVSVSLDSFEVPDKVVYIFGNEIDGVSRALLEVSDMAIEIPMLGMKESLNVSVTTGIVLFKK